MSNINILRSQNQYRTGINFLCLISDIGSCHGNDAAKLGITSIRSLFGSFVMPIGILVLVAMMVLPLPLFAGYFCYQYIIIFTDFDGGDAYTSPA